MDFRAFTTRRSVEIMVEEMEEKYEPISGKIYFIFNVKYPNLSRYIDIALLICMIFPILGSLFLVSFTETPVEGLWVLLIILIVISIFCLPILLVITLIRFIGTWKYVNNFLNPARSEQVGERSEGAAEERKGGEQGRKA